MVSMTCTDKLPSSDRETKLEWILVIATAEVVKYSNASTKQFLSNFLR